MLLFTPEKCCWMNWKSGHLSELLHGRRYVSAAMALKSEKLLNIPAEYWMRVQVYYDPAGAWYIF